MMSSLNRDTSLLVFDSQPHICKTVSQTWQAVPTGHDLMELQSITDK